MATALTDGSGGVTVYSNDVSNDFATSYTSARPHRQSSRISPPTAHTLGSALTLNDGTHNASFYYVAQNANAADGTFTAIGPPPPPTARCLPLSPTRRPAVNATITPSNPGGNGYLQLAAANNVGITVSGALGSALGFSTSQYKNNYNSQLAGITATIR